MRIFLQILLGSIILLPVQSQDNRIALVIGNSDYQHGGELANPVNDARSMERALEAVGFDVRRYENLDQKSMKQAIDNFGYDLKQSDVGLFFYAGHGVQASGYNYLIPVDAELNTESDVEYNCVRADRILGKMESAGNETNIVIMDACRNNPFERSWNRSAKGRGLAFMNAPTGSLIAYATSPGSTASDGSGSNGLYTSALLRYMVQPDITVLEMFQKVRTHVRRSSGNTQIPWESTSLEGNFYFYSRSDVTDFSGSATNSPDHPLDEASLRRRFTDHRDGKVYNTAKIGSQVWMAENLAYKPFSGNCWAYDNNTSNISVYGYLYDLETAKTVCPSGWHLPSDAEWAELTDYLGGEAVAGGKLKESGASHWEGPNSGATNECGFSALPGGIRFSTGTFKYVGNLGFWWSSTESETRNAWYRFMNSGHNKLIRGNDDKSIGRSVRCVKD